MNASPSSRRAWIEILKRLAERLDNQVALLAEGVDRNLLIPEGVALAQVALLAEGVDRNMLQATGSKVSLGRPPRGGRG